MLFASEKYMGLTKTTWAAAQ